VSLCRWCSRIGRPCRAPRGVRRPALPRVHRPCRTSAGPGRRRSWPLPLLAAAAPGRCRSWPLHRTHIARRGGGTAPRACNSGCLHALSPALEGTTSSGSPGHQVGELAPALAAAAEGDHQAGELAPSIAAGGRDRAPGWRAGADARRGGGPRSSTRSASWRRCRRSPSRCRWQRDGVRNDKNPPKRVQCQGIAKFRLQRAKERHQVRVLLLGKSDRKPSVIKVDDGVEVLGETVVEERLCIVDQSLS